MKDWLMVFAERLRYADDVEGITLEVILSSDRAIKVPVDVKLDTGSPFCVLQRRYAEMLDLDVERGTRERIGTATGSFIAYDHEVTVTVGELEWQAVVYFAESEYFPINVVGRVGFLDRLRVGIVDYEQWLYLDAYHDGEAIY